MMNLNYRQQIKSAKAALVMFVFVVVIAGQTHQLSADAAATLFQEERWIEAANAYEELTKAEPANGRFWYRLGQSLARAGKHQEAVRVFLIALDKVNTDNRTAVMYNLAAAFARLEDREQSILWLNKAVDDGFNQFRQLASDPDFEGFRNDEQFKALVNKATINAHPCAGKPEYQQLTFWVGEWEVQNAPNQPGAGQVVGRNIIQPLVDQCALMENYSEGADYSGKSVNFYDATLHKWRQTWIDSNGGVSEFSGEYKEGAMRFTGESHLPNGSKVLRHMTLFNLGSERVRQLSEASTDEGKTWHVNYDFLYLRKK